MTKRVIILVIVLAGWCLAPPALLAAQQAPTTTDDEAATPPEEEATPETPSEKPTGETPETGEEKDVTTPVEGEKIAEPPVVLPEGETAIETDPGIEGTKAGTKDAETGKEGTETGTEGTETSPGDVVTPAPEKYPEVETSQRNFIKGDLIYPGTRRLLSRFDHVGVSLGASLIDNDVWATVSPGMAWYFDFGLAVSAHVPMRLLAVDIAGSDYSFGGLKIRRQDWDEVADFAKIIRFITYGRKEDNIYATINTMRPATIGHGMLMNNYQGDIDVDRSLTGLIFDAYNDYAGCQLQINDITIQNQVFAGLAFVKPLSIFLDDYRSKSLSLGVEYVIDTKAPRCIRKSVDSAECVRGTGHTAGYSLYTGETLDESFVRTDPDSGRFAVKDVAVNAIGGSVEFKFYKDDVADLKVYGTYHQFLNQGGGGGAAAGILARLNIGQKWISAFRIRGEYRTFGDGFQPAYFNTLYEIQKYSFLQSARYYQVAPTKYQQVFGDPENGFERVEHGRRHGFNVDLNWGLFKGRRSAKQVALGLGIQDSTGPYDTNMYVHLEFPMLEWLQIFGTYMRTDVDGLAKVFTESTDFIVLTGMRLMVFPGMFINAHYSRSYRTIASPGVELHLGNDTIVDVNNNPSPFFKQDSLHENVHMFFAEVEFGWEFDDDDDE
ncbi:MAG: hypothetical protein JRJ87_18180 [Deltaproteobacteria bacterium]|nr:hypothetical protein [Deltaproteobacteria bacterium]